MRLMLVDDHSLFLEGLQYLLETHGIEIVGTAKNGMEAVEKVRILKPDIIMMDIKMPECSGLDALKKLKAEIPNIKVVMLTTSEEDDDLFEAIKHGASGYLLKNTNAKELVEMLYDIEKGEASFSSDLAIRLLKEFKENSNNEHRLYQYGTKKLMCQQLSERQLEVLEMVAKGITYKEVGETLGLTERTVKYHMGKILELLQLENRAQVIAYAAHTGIVEKLR